MKDIKSALKMIENQENIVRKIAIFLKTKRGQQFVKKLHTIPLRDLCRIYQAPSFIRLFKNDLKNKNLIIAAIKQYDIPIPVYKPIQIGSFERVKYPVYLTKAELAKIDARRPKKMGFAALMHAYEEHMMNKFIKTHPAPTERELAEDLFPEELKAGYDNVLFIHREYVRNLLCERYANRINKDNYFRIFKVLSISSDLATGKKHEPVISEVEYTDCYAFTNSPKNTEYTILHDKLKKIAAIAHKNDSNVIKVKLYNKYGVFIDSCNC